MWLQQIGEADTKLRPTSGSGNQWEEWKSATDRRFQWRRRRRIDGALTRVPSGFYARVWRLLDLVLTPPAPHFHPTHISTNMQFHLVSTEQRISSLTTVHFTFNIHILVSNTYVYTVIFCYNVYIHISMYSIYFHDC